MQEYPDDDFDMRFKVVDPGFTPAQDSIYDSAISHLKEGLEKGWAWKRVSDSVQIADPKLKAVILDDFLKITIAERHFQGKESLDRVAKALKVPTDLLIALREAMIEEVSESAVKVYNMSEEEKNKS
jgi:hypothetical protein